MDCPSIPLGVPYIYFELFYFLALQGWPALCVWVKKSILVNRPSIHLRVSVWQNNGLLYSIAFMEYHVITLQRRAGRASAV